MTGFVMFIHAFVALLLIVIILMQSGRGGGLTEGFASAESLFGARTNEFMIKATTIFATIFLVTCMGLAVLSTQKGKSLMSDQAAPVQQMPVAQTVEKAAKETSAQLEVIEEKAAEEPIAEIPVATEPENIPVAPAPETN